jgi:hypothetical protein
MAQVRRRLRWYWLWLLPLAALGLAAGLLFTAWIGRGIEVVVELPHGHGLKPGDAVRYRGIAVGSVRDLALTDDLTAIRAEVRLDSGAKELAREGSQFWVVRPQVDISGASGLSTIIGANYLGVIPGTGPYKHRFKGLEEPPLLAVLEAGGLELTLATSQQGGVRAGAPISYREVVIGKILSLDLARDASAVEFRAYVEPRYASLVREGTRFWKVGGAHLRAGFTGVSLDVDPVNTLILGGVTLAIPPDPGAPVVQGRRFQLYEEPEQEWLDWVPFMALEAADASRPHPVALELAWHYKQYLYLTTEGYRRGWGLPVEGGVLAPEDLLRAPPDALEEGLSLRVDGQQTKPVGVQPFATGLALLPLEHRQSAWQTVPTSRLQRAEDLLIIADPERPMRYVAADRLVSERGGWRIAAEVPFDANWHGASVVSDQDGRLVGLLLVDDSGARIAELVPEQTPQPRPDPESEAGLSWWQHMLGRP